MKALTFSARRGWWICASSQPRSNDTTNITPKRTQPRLLVLAVGLSLICSIARAHEEGAPFSGAIIDPLALHHAHIENEQRLNFFALRGVRDSRGRNRSAFEGELELAYASKDFKYGFELFVPFANIPASGDDGRETGIGDIEIRPLKYALLNTPDFVISTATGIGLPTGSKSRGLGEGNTSLSQFLFVDKAVGNWFVGANLAPRVNVSGETDLSLGYGTVASYSFIRGTEASGTAAPRPAQRWVFSPSVEFIGERGFRGENAGQNSTSLIPGLNFWHIRSGWQIPTSGSREADRTFLIQIGNHFNWAALFRKRASTQK